MASVAYGRVLFRRSSDRLNTLGLEVTSVPRDRPVGGQYVARHGHELNHPWRRTDDVNQDTPLPNVTGGLDLDSSAPCTAASHVCHVVGSIQIEHRLSRHIRDEWFLLFKVVTDQLSDTIGGFRRHEVVQTMEEAAHYTKTVCLSFFLHMDVALDFFLKLFSLSTFQKNKQRRKKFMMEERSPLTRTGINLPMKKDNTINPDLLKHTIEVENKQLEYEHQDKQWRSCCFSLHKESSVFFGKLVVSLATMSLCAYQLVQNTDNCTAQVGYSSTISLIVGAWLRM